MLTGRGKQYHLTKEYLDLREKGLLNRTKLTTQEQSDADISFPDGGGSTDLERTYIFDNIPIPADRGTKKIDLRNTKRYGLD